MTIKATLFGGILCFSFGCCSNSSETLEGSSVRIVRSNGGRCYRAQSYADFPEPPWLRNVLRSVPGNPVVEVDLQNTLGKTNDKTIADLSPLRQLCCLRLGNTDVGDEGILSLAAFPELVDVGLNHTKVTNLGIERLAKFAKLTHLSLIHTEVTDAGLPPLVSISSLIAVDLSHTRVGDSGLSILSAMRDLNELELRGTNISDACIDSIAALRLLDSFSTVRLAFWCIKTRNPSVFDVFRISDSKM